MWLECRQNDLVLQRLNDKIIKRVHNNRGQEYTSFWPERYFYDVPFGLERGLRWRLAPWCHKSACGMNDSFKYIDGIWMK